MIDFLKLYYKELILIVLCVLEFILSLIALIKKSRKESPLLSLVIRALPKYINIVENCSPIGHGEEKKALVLEYVEKLFNDCKCDFDEVTKKIVDEAIENILSTPQKKGVM